jgi:TolB-like protein/tetratricopeptide (TPR) repeat protein
MDRPNCGHWLPCNGPSKAAGGSLAVRYWGTLTKSLHMADRAGPENPKEPPATPAPWPDSSKGVFLSYASQDAEAATRISEALSAGGIAVWFDQGELRGGDAWDQMIRRQIKACHLFVPIISANTQAREEGYFRREWKLAVERTHDMADNRAFLLPIVIDDTSDATALVPEKFREVQWTRLPVAANADSFVQHVRRLLSVDTTTLAATRNRSPTATASSPQVISARPTSSTARSFVLWIIGGVLLLGIGYLLIDKLVPSTHEVQVVHAPAKVPAPTETVTEKSIAVLPFIDMSEKKDQEYFSDGLSEELIDLLSRVPDLRVPARTSSFYFKGRAAKIPDIGKELSVANVLEGSVRKSGKMVRVTVQLIRVDSGFHVWSQTYDRPLIDIFKVQDQIAAAVVSSLKVSLLKGTAPTVNGTSSSEAHDLYLQAKSMSSALSYGDSKAQMEKVVEYLRSALRLDPAYGQAWVLLSQVLTDQALYGYISGAPIREAAHQAATKAIALNLDSSDSHTAMARVFMLLDRDWAAGLAQVRQALALDSNDSWALVCEGMIEVYGGRLDSGIPHLERSVSIDPINESRLFDLARAYYAAGRYADSETAYHKVLDLDPSLKEGHSALAEVLLVKDGPAAALDENDGETDAESREAGQAIIYYALGRRSEADMALADIERKYAETSACDIARIHAYRAEIEDAFKWLGRVREPHCLFSKVDPYFNILRPDPRFNAFLRNMKLPE